MNLGYTLKWEMLLIKDHKLNGYVYMKRSQIDKGLGVENNRKE